MKLDIRFGGYQEPGRSTTRRARFGERLTQALGARVGFELISSILKLRPALGDLCDGRARGELSLLHVNVRFSRAARI